MKLRRNPFSSLTIQALQWLEKLSCSLNPSFVLAIILIFGLSHGFTGSYFRVASDFYWKDVQKSQPSSAQIYAGLYCLPSIMKPIWGLLTDVFPVMGYRRRPYFVAAGVIGAASAAILTAFQGVPAMVAVGCLIGVETAKAIADVTMDACIAKKSIEVRALATDMQSLGSFCSSVGALVGYSSSGFLVHSLGAQGAMGFLAIPPASMFVLGFSFGERKITRHHSKNIAIGGRLRRIMEDMLRTIRLPQVWRPSLYMYLSLALNISTHEGQFYWYTHPTAGPAFSQEFVGVVYAVGALGSVIGVLVYHKLLRDLPFRNILFLAQLLYGVSGMLDLIFILRWNLKVRIPDPLFVILEEGVLRLIARVRWVPMMVLSSRLCPLGIEGTFFALLMCIDSLGTLSAKWGGGLLLHLLGVSRTDFSNLWLAVFIRNSLRLGTLALIFLVPGNAGQVDVLVPCSDGFSKEFGKGDGYVPIEDDIDKV